ncbi:DUF2834 domain-containing protein [Rhodobacteraceae bacterium XHP0102]|nr:DUF2834 domain-containing protein [Rhodobacteraceae bacterium XHP0102]
MSVLRMIYLVLAVVGTIVPMQYFLPWLAANEWSIMAMVEAWHANDASSGLVWDLTIAALTLNIWILVEGIARRDWLSLLAIPTIYGIGVSCALPLYLFLRSRNEV